MLSLSILGVMLVISASLFVGYTRIQKQATPQERNLVLGSSALERMRNEVVSAVALFEPAPPSTATVARLAFEKVDPSVTSRLPSPPVFTGTFEPFDLAYSCQVVYSVSAGKLSRQAWGNGWTSQEVLVEEVAGMTLNYVPPRGLRIRINLVQGSNQRILESTSHLWSLP
jgi:hypothetical protein